MGKQDGRDSAERLASYFDGHVPNSITSMRRQLIVGVARALSRCPCCATPILRQNEAAEFVTQYD